MRRKAMLPRAKEPPRHRRTFIREWREFRDLDQGEVTARIEQLSGESISISQLSRKERGVSRVHQNDLDALSKIYDCSVLDLMNRDPKAQEGPLEIFESLTDEEKARTTRFMLDLRNTTPDGSA